MRILITIIIGSSHHAELTCVMAKFSPLLPIESTTRKLTRLVLSKQEFRKRPWQSLSMMRMNQRIQLNFLRRSYGTMTSCITGTRSPNQPLSTRTRCTLPHFRIPWLTTKSSTRSGASTSRRAWRQQSHSSRWRKTWRSKMTSSSTIMLVRPCSPFTFQLTSKETSISTKSLTKINSWKKLSYQYVTELTRKSWSQRKSQASKRLSKKKKSLMTLKKKMTTQWRISITHLSMFSI